MNAMNTYARPASTLGMPATTRRALTSDDVDTGHGYEQSADNGQRYSEQSAETIGRRGEQGQPFIELSSFESLSPMRDSLHRAVSEASLRVESPMWIGDVEALPDSPQQHLALHPSPLQQSSSVQESSALHQHAPQRMDDTEDEYGQFESTAGVEDVNDDPHLRLL